MSRKRAVRAKSDDHEAHALAEDALGRRLVSEPWIEPCEISDARLDDRAVSDGYAQMLAVFGFRNEPDPDVRIEHHETPAVLAADQIDQCGRHGLQHQP